MSRAEAPEFPAQRAAILYATPWTAPIKDCTPLLMVPQTPRCPAIALSGQLPMLPCSHLTSNTIRIVQQIQSLKPNLTILQVSLRCAQIQL